MVNIIVAVSENGVIGSNNDLVFKISDDLKRFKQITTGNTVVMGRKTFESIGKALPNRRNIVITRNTDFSNENVEVVSSIDKVLELTKDDDIFIIGGGEIYRQFLDLKIVDKIYLTYICENVEKGDTFFSYSKEDFNCEYTEERESNGVKYKFINLVKK